MNTIIPIPMMSVQFSSEDHQPDQVALLGKISDDDSNQLLLIGILASEEEDPRDYTIEGLLETPQTPIYYYHPHENPIYLGRIGDDLLFYPDDPDAYEWEMKLVDNN